MAESRHGSMAEYRRGSTSSPSRQQGKKNRKKTAADFMSTVSRVAASEKDEVPKYEDMTSMQVGLNAILDHVRDEVEGLYNAYTDLAAEQARAAEIARRQREEAEEAERLAEQQLARAQFRRRVDPGRLRPKEVIPARPRKMPKADEPEESDENDDNDDKASENSVQAASDSSSSEDDMDQQGYAAKNFEEQHAMATWQVDTAHEALENHLECLHIDERTAELEGMKRYFDGKAEDIETQEAILSNREEFLNRATRKLDDEVDVIVQQVDVKESRVYRALRRYAVQLRTASGIPADDWEDELRIKRIRDQIAKSRSDPKEERRQRESGALRQVSSKLSRQKSLSNVIHSGGDMLEVVAAVQEDIAAYQASLDIEQERLKAYFHSQRLLYDNAMGGNESSQDVALRDNVAAQVITEVRRWEKSGKVVAGEEYKENANTKEEDAWDTVRRLTKESKDLQRKIKAEEKRRDELLKLSARMSEASAVLPLEHLPRTEDMKPWEYAQWRNYEVFDKRVQELYEADIGRLRGESQKAHAQLQDVHAVQLLAAQSVPTLNEAAKKIIAAAGGVKENCKVKVLPEDDEEDSAVLKEVRQANVAEDMDSKKLFQENMAALQAKEVKLTEELAANERESARLSAEIEEESRKQDALRPQLDEALVRRQLELRQNAEEDEDRKKVGAIEMSNLQLETEIKKAQVKLQFAQEQAAKDAEKAAASQAEVLGIVQATKRRMGGRRSSLMPKGAKPASRPGSPRPDGGAGSKAGSRAASPRPSSKGSAKESPRQGSKEGDRGSVVSTPDGGSARPESRMSEMPSLIEEDGGEPSRSPSRAGAGAGVAMLRQLQRSKEGSSGPPTPVPGQAPATPSPKGATPESAGSGRGSGASRLKGLVRSTTSLGGLAKKETPQEKIQRLLDEESRDNEAATELETQVSELDWYLDMITYTAVQKLDKSSEEMAEELEEMFPSVPTELQEIRDATAKKTAQKDGLATAWAEIRGMMRKLTTNKRATKGKDGDTFKRQVLEVCNKAYEEAGIKPPVLPKKEEVQEKAKEPTSGRGEKESRDRRKSVSGKSRRQSVPEVSAFFGAGGPGRKMGKTASAASAPGAQRDRSGSLTPESTTAAAGASSEGFKSHRERLKRQSSSVAASSFAGRGGPDGDIGMDTLQEHHDEDEAGDDFAAPADLDLPGGCGPDSRTVSPPLSPKMAGDKSAWLRRLGTGLGSSPSRPG